VKFRSTPDFVAGSAHGGSDVVARLQRHQRISEIACLKLLQNVLNRSSFAEVICSVLEQKKKMPVMLLEHLYVLILKLFGSSKLSLTSVGEYRS